MSLFDKTQPQPMSTQIIFVLASGSCRLYNWQQLVLEPSYHKAVVVAKLWQEMRGISSMGSKLLKHESLRLNYIKYIKFGIKLKVLPQDIKLMHGLYA